MTRTVLHLQTQSELRDEIEDYLNDSTNELATAAQYYSNINRAISLWAGRVVVPHLYEFDFSTGTTEYTLPSYIRRPFTVRIRRNGLGFPVAEGDESSLYTWSEFVSYSVHPNGVGGYTLQVNGPANAEAGQIEWYAENGRFPVTAPTVTTTINSTATSVVLTVTGAPPINDAGYIKIESEWLAYAGVTRTSSTSYTLNNLIRGLYGTVAASHVSTTAVAWGIAVDDERVFQQLYDRTGSFIHFLNMHKSTTEDSSRHEKLYVALRDSADGFWRREGYTTQKSPRLIPTQGSMGGRQWM